MREEAVTRSAQNRAAADQARAERNAAYNRNRQSQGFQTTTPPASGYSHGTAARQSRTANLAIDRSAEVAQAQQERAADEAAYNALPDAGAALTRQMDGFILKDSAGWFFNQYDPGSINHVKVVEGSVKSGNFIMAGEYTYNGGSPGRVVVNMVSGAFGCIQFWDSRIGCRGLRTAEQGELVRQALAGAMIGAMSDGGSSSGETNERERELQKSRDAFDDFTSQQRAREAGTGF